MDATIPCVDTGQNALQGPPDSWLVHKLVMLNVIRATRAKQASAVAAATTGLALTRIGHGQPEIQWGTLPNEMGPEWVLDPGTSELA